MDPVPVADDLDDKLDDIESDAEEVGKEIKLTADGGVIKKVLKVGEGWETPSKGDVVEVHYVGTLEDGSKFDSSRDRGDPFTFTLGTGNVIKGWDEGVKTMKKGEKSLLTCKSDYAYGASGSPPKIPPHATLNFEVELLGWKSVKDIMGDGGIIKTINKEGSDWQKPEDRDEVLIHMKAKVEGADNWFFETPAEGVEFTLQDGYFCKGVVDALKTMQKGEEVHLKLKPEYGFGEAGKGDEVPPNSNLELSLHLVSWKKVENVTDDGLVFKKTVKEATEWKKPNEGAKVTVRYTATLPDGTVFDQHLEGDELVFITDEDAVIDGLEQAIKKMKKDEHALVTIAPQYAFGDKEHQGKLAVVPPNTTVTYAVELVDFENAKETWDMKDDEKVAAANVKKEKGNKAYKENKLQRAISYYDKAVNMINYDKNFSDDLKHASKEVKKSCWLNLAAAQLKLHNYKEVNKNCEKVLEVDSGNIKALYRRAQSFLATQDFVEAECDLKRGLEEAPDNADLLALQKKLKVVMRVQNKKEAKLYSRMFAGLGKADSKDQSGHEGHSAEVTGPSPDAAPADAMDATPAPAAEEQAAV